MTNINKKKKNPIILFLLALVVIVVVMFIANYKSMLMQELRGPEAGVEKLSTHGEQLVAISPNNEIYAWDWNDLSSWPQIGSVNAQKVAAMSSDRLVWIPHGINNILVVGNLKGDKQLWRLSLGVNKKCKWLQASPNGKYAVAALAIDDGSDNRIQLAAIDPDLTSISQVLTKTMGDKFTLNNIGVSNDGAFVTAVGGKDAGWIIVAHAQSKQILWEKTVPNSRELNNVVFSPNGQMVYASESGRRVYIFDIAAKKLVKRLEMDKYKTPANNPQTISCIAVSPDGRLLAAASAPKSKVWVWDAKSGAKIDVIGTGHFCTSDISFSPDSSLLAIADLTTSPIKIWRISENP